MLKTNKVNCKIMDELRNLFSAKFIASAEASGAFPIL